MQMLQPPVPAPASATPSRPGLPGWLMWLMFLGWGEGLMDDFAQNGSSMLDPSAHRSSFAPPASTDDPHSRYQY